MLVVSIRPVSGFVLIHQLAASTARAADGTWLRPDVGKRYPTLNQLNESIAAGNENIWNGNWKYRADDGAIRSINELRR